MKLLSRTRAFEKLKKLKDDLGQVISKRYEFRAKDCETCETKGACCLDAHFVNVHISRLEGEAVREVLNELPDEKRVAVDLRIDDAIRRYQLSSEKNTFSQTYACPLFEKEIGCLVHGKAKPLACIAHACYEKKEDLPPPRLLAEQEVRVDRLNELTYGRSEPWLPIPLAIRRQGSSDEVFRQVSSSE